MGVTGQDRFSQFDGLLHGGDYNPEQWLDYPEILKEDVRLMKLAGINSVSLGIFAWSAYEPEEGVFTFEWMDEILNRMNENGISVILATPSGARPAWLDTRYPECMRVSADGVRDIHGNRHNHCMSSPAFRERLRIIDLKLAQRYGGHPAIMMWHISNELSGECFCPLCRERFREYLRRIYKNDIALLNHAWWTAFWSHRYNDFDQIEPPFRHGENSVQGLLLDWKRFTTWNMTDCMKFEIDTVKAVTPGIPCTTNFMRSYGGLDYNELAKHIDIISWDNYPSWHTDAETMYDTAADTAYEHASMRSFKRGRPFMMMESTPSQVNWQQFNKLKRPGIHILSSLQAIACGSDTVQYFQWRKSRGSFEQHHGAVISHDGSADTRVFREVAELGKLLEKLKPVKNTIVTPEAAIIYDWPNRWAIEDLAGMSSERKYIETCRMIGRVMTCGGVETDVVSPEADLSRYKVVIAPMLYLLTDDAACSLRSYVQNGGTLIATYLTGYVHESTLCYLGGFPGGGLREVFGIRNEEIDPLYPGDRNSVTFLDGSGFSGKYEVMDFCEVIHAEGAETLAEYDTDFYRGMPAVTRNRFGSGRAYYVAARMEPQGMAQLLNTACRLAGVTAVDLPEGVECHKREDGSHAYWFYLNWTGEEKTVNVPVGSSELAGSLREGVALLPPYGYAVVSAPV